MSDLASGARLGKYSSPASLVSWSDLAPAQFGPAAAVGEAEIEQLHVAVAPEDDVVGLDVAVCDARGVRGGERLGHLRRDVDAFEQRERPRVEARAKRLTLDILGHDVVRAVGLPDVEDREDVRVVQGGGGAGLCLEAPHAVGIHDEGQRQELERDAATEARVGGEIDLAHPARAEQREDAVGADLAHRTGARRVGGHAARRHPHRGGFDKHRGPPVGREQDFDLAL
jgi:hypothetical protein